MIGQEVGNNLTSTLQKEPGNKKSSDTANRKICAKDTQTHFQAIEFKHMIVKKKSAFIEN